MTYHDKVQLTLIIIAPPGSSGGGRPPLSEPRVLDGVYALPYRDESSPELQRVQGAGALKPDGSQLRPDRQRVFHPDRDL